jgi:hypothetical protein
MSELREKIVTELCGVHSQSSIDEIRAIADAILAIPEIAEAQRRIQELEAQIDLMDGDMREMIRDD